MRISIEIDDELMTSALEANGLRTKQEAIKEGLKLLIQIKSQANLQALRGKLQWKGNIHKMKADK